MQFRVQVQVIAIVAGRQLDKFLVDKQNVYKTHIYLAEGDTTKSCKIVNTDAIEMYTIHDDDDDDDDDGRDYT